MGKLAQIIEEEYVLSSHEYKIRRFFRVKEKKSLDNKSSFLEDLHNKKLDRYVNPAVYIETFVLYKDGILCGQSKDREVLENEGKFALCEPNLAIYVIPANKQELNPTNLINTQTSS